MELYNVLIAPRAQRDLDKIYAYVARNLLEPDVALRLVGKIEEAILSLNRFPSRCSERRIGAYANKGYRQLFVENYTVVFRIDERKQQVIVLTVRYSKSDF